ncbi:hypothetical protein Hanom_Chr09g00871341 [Helianthus anomalus]
MNKLFYSIDGSYLKKNYFLHTKVYVMSINKPLNQGEVPVKRTFFVKSVRRHEN